MCFYSYTTNYAHFLQVQLYGNFGFLSVSFKSLFAYKAVKSFDKDSSCHRTLFNNWNMQFVDTYAFGNIKFLWQ